MKMRRLPWTGLAIGSACVAAGVVVVLLLSSGARGTMIESPGAPPGVEAKADALLREMSQALAGAGALRFTAHDMIDQVMDNGQKLQFTRVLNVEARRPGSVHVDVKGDAEHNQFWFDDSKLTVVNHRERCYARQDVPASIDEMFDFLAERFGITAPLSDLLFSDPHAAMTGRVRSGQYIGLHRVGPTQCHHLAFRQDGIDWQIWIEQSPRPVPRKIVITYKELPGQPQFIALLDEWDLEADVPETTFKATVPSGYKQVDLVPVGGPAAPARP